MSTTPEDPNPPGQPQPLEVPESPPPDITVPDVQTPGDGGTGGGESEKPLVIP